MCLYLFLVFASPCWFSAAVLHKTLCVWHKLSWTVLVKYKKFYTEIEKFNTKIQQMQNKKKYLVLPQICFQEALHRTLYVRHKLGWTVPVKRSFTQKN